MPHMVFTVDEMRRGLPFGWDWRTRPPVTGASPWHVVLNEEIMVLRRNMTSHRLPGDTLCGKRYGWDNAGRQRPAVRCTPCAVVASTILTGSALISRRDDRGEWLSVRVGQR